MNNRNEERIYIYLVIAVIVISFAAIMIKLATAPPLIIAFYRMFFSSIILTPIFLYKYKKQYRLFFNYRIILAGIALAFHFVFWITAFEFTSVANAVIFVALQPLFTLFLEYLFSREDLKRKTVIGVILAIVGSIIISAGDINILFSRVWGDILALIGGFFAAIYLFIGRNLREKVDYFPYIYVIYVYAALCIALCIVFTGFSFTGYTDINYLYFLGLALGPTLIGHSIFNYSVRFVPASIVSLSFLLEPLITTVLARLILKEVIASATIYGGIIILSGIYVATYNNNKK